MGNRTSSPHENTPFELKWGERADAIAQREGLTTDSIHMRIRNFGNPYQRRAKPTKWERKYWKTTKELCYEFNLHLQTLEQREKKFGTVYCKDALSIDNNKAFVHRKRKPKQPCMKPVAHIRPWLMKEHPDYIAWRSGVMFPDDYNALENNSLNKRQNYPEWSKNGQD